MTATRDDLDPRLIDAIEAGTPYARTLAPELISVSPGRCVLTLDCPEQLRNHVDGPHAATLFGLAETAAAGVLASLFQDLVEAGNVPLIKGAQVSYRSIATGSVTATATFSGDADGVRDSVALRGVAVFDVTVELTTADGTVASVMTMQMALKRL